MRRTGRIVRLSGGLTAVLAVVVACGGPAAGGTAAGAVGRAGGVTRTYFLAAEEVAWNYAPAGRNEITGRPFDDAAKVFVERRPGRIGSTYLKALYVRYADAGFARRVPRPAADGYFGFLGPVIRAEVGDTIRVVFRNRVRFPASVHPHGVLYDKSNEGARTPTAPAAPRRATTPSRRAGPGRTPGRCPPVPVRGRWTAVR